MARSRGRIPNLGSKIKNYFLTDDTPLTDIGTGNVTLLQIPNVIVPPNAKVLLKAWTNMVILNTPRQFQFQRNGVSFGQATLTDNVEASKLTHYQDFTTTAIYNLGTGFVNTHSIANVVVATGDIVLLMVSDVFVVDSSTARNFLFGRNAVQQGPTNRIDNSAGIAGKTETATAVYVDLPSAGTYTYNIATVNGAATDDFLEGTFEIFVIKQDAAFASKTNHQLYIDTPTPGTYTYSYITFSGNAGDDIGDRVMEIDVLLE